LIEINEIKLLTITVYTLLLLLYCAHFAYHYQNTHYDI